MADSDGEAVDMVQQRRRRAWQIKAARFLLEDVQEFVRTTNADTSSLSILAEKGIALNTILLKGNQCMDLIRFEEEDAELIKKDKAERAIFFDITTQISNICQEMGAVKRLTRTSKSVKQAIEKIEALTLADLSKDYSDCFTEVNYQVAVLTSGLFDSTIDPGHELWREKEDFANRMLELKSGKKITAPSSNQSLTGSSACQNSTYQNSRVS